MKLIRNIYLLLTLALAAQINNSFSMNLATTIAKTGVSGICSLAELLVTSTPIIATTLNRPKIKARETLADTKCIAPQIITDYITQIAKDRGKNDIQVILDKDCYEYEADPHNPIIYINPRKADELKSLLQNNTRQPEEEEKLNEHIGNIHHELTHQLRDSQHRLCIYKATVGTIGAAIISSTLSHVIKKHALPLQVQKNFIFKNGFKIARSGLTFSLASYLMKSNIEFIDNLYRRHEEIQADNGIPNKKELLEPQVKLYETRHLDSLKYVSFIKTTADYSDIVAPAKYNCNRFELLTMKAIPISWFNNPYIMTAILHSTHPSDIQRALLFKKRIKDIDQNGASINSPSFQNSTISL